MAATEVRVTDATGHLVEAGLLSTGQADAYVRYLRRRPLLDHQKPLTMQTRAYTGNDEDPWTTEEVIP